MLMVVEITPLVSYNIASPLRGRYASYEVEAY